MTSASPLLSDTTPHWLTTTRHLSEELLHAVGHDPEVSFALLRLDTVDCLQTSPRSTELDHLLSGAELHHFSTFRFTKRRLEWLGGRLAAKLSLCNLLGLSIPRAFKELTLLPDRHGRPELSTDVDYPPCSLSISHSKEYATAMACTSHRCGIDLQQKSDKLLKLEARFVTRQEHPLLDQAMATQDRVTQLALIWVAKEAVKKAHLSTEPTFFERITVCDLQPEARPNAYLLRCTIADSHQSQVRVRAIDLGDYLLAWCRGGPHA